jgi:diguanylate cyclase (GGDEF)-like protein
MIRPGVRLFTTRGLATAITLYSIAGALVFSDINMVGITQHSVMGVMLIALAVALWWSGAEGVTWLLGAIGLRGLLAFAEAGAYMLQWQRPWQGTLATLVEPSGAFLAASSSIDMAAEWLVVLGSVLAVSDRGRRALEISHQRLVMAQDDLRQLADRDALTGAINRRALRDIFNEVQKTGAMLLFFDLDGFKQINDEHGHAAGDHMLRAFADCVRMTLRKTDLAFRYGGDEFVIALPQTGVEQAKAVVQKLRQAYSAVDFSDAIAHLAAQPTLSIGVAERSVRENLITLPTLLAAADSALYEAKKADRNCIKIYSNPQAA